MTSQEQTITHRPSGSMCAVCRHSGQNCAHLNFAAMRVIRRDPDGVRVVKCGEFATRAQGGE